MERKNPKTFVVTLKGIAPFVSEVRYEKEAEDLKLYFTLQKEAKVNVIVEDDKVNYKRLAPLGALSKKLLSKVEYKPSSDLYLTVATAKDFQECQATPKTLKDAFQELQQCGSEDASLLVVFEPREGGAPQGLLWTKKQELKRKTLAKFSGKERGNWALFQGRGQIAELKDSLKELL